MKQPSISSVFTQAKHNSQPAHAGSPADYIQVDLGQAAAKATGAAAGKRDRSGKAKGGKTAAAAAGKESVTKIVLVEKASPKVAQAQAQQ